jgi:hypothetical protein
VVEQHDVVDARHPHLAHALVPLDHERLAAEPLRGRDRQCAEELALVFVQRRLIRSYDSSTAAAS